MTDARVAGLTAEVALVPASNTMRVFGVQLDVAWVYGGPAGPSVKVWDGSAEVGTTVSVWDGSAEVAATVSEVTS